MRKPIRLLVLLAAVGAQQWPPRPAALWRSPTSAGFGQHVALCAREHLGQRADAPAVTCTMPDGTRMTFATFGAMVQQISHSCFLLVAAKTRSGMERVKGL